MKMAGPFENEYSVAVSLLEVVNELLFCFPNCNYNLDTEALSTICSEYTIIPTYTPHFSLLLTHYSLCVYRLAGSDCTFLSASIGKCIPPLNEKASKQISGH